MSYLLAHPSEVAWLFLQHCALVGTALVIGFAIALPLGISAARSPRFATPMYGTLAAIYTIPSLALLALIVVLFGLGFWPTVIALVAYAQFVLARNVAAGVRGVPESQTDAARGLGMTSMQRLWRIELPLATPVILGGLRIAVVAMIALATLGGYVNAGGLGVLIFRGLDTQYTAQTLAGSIPAALLAIAADLFFRAIERRAVSW
ncbi:MAG TPA: ABC transporter permease [Candidatus Baltobacteraceae bacterium]